MSAAPVRVRNIPSTIGRSSVTSAPSRAAADPAARSRAPLPAIRFFSPDSDEDWASAPGPAQASSAAQAAIDATLDRFQELATRIDVVGVEREDKVASASAAKANLRRRAVAAFVRGDQATQLIAVMGEDIDAQFRSATGFTFALTDHLVLDAGVRIEAEDRSGLERLLRYCARPPFAMERLRKEGAALVYRCAKQRSEPTIYIPCPANSLSIKFSESHHLTDVILRVP